MSWGDLLEGVVSKGLDIYEQKELYKLGVMPAQPTANNGTSGSAAGLPDQSIVYRPQEVGPVGEAGSSGTVEILGMTMSSDLLQATALILVALFIFGKLK